MERKDGEKYKSFLSRVIEAKASGNITYDEMGDLLVDDNRWSSENWRKGYYILKSIVERLDKDTEITQSDVIAELEQKKNEIYKETVKLRDQRRELNKLKTSQARFENLKDVIVERLDDIGTLPRDRYFVKSDTRKGATLICSDWHIGAEIDNQFNAYNVDIAKDRVRQLTDKAIMYCKQHSITDLNVELGGDFVNGTIHTSCRVQQEEDIIQQIIDCSEIISNMINDLAENIENITIYSVFGNHGRVISGKHDSVNRENFERLIYHYVKSRVKDVKFIDSHGEDFIKYHAFGKTFVLAHGDKDKLGSVVDTYSSMFKEHIDEVHIGHFHSFKEISEYDTTVIVNGSIMGSDDYAVSIRKTGKPLQVLRVYGDDDCTYKIILN